MIHMARIFFKVPFTIAYLYIRIMSKYPSAHMRRPGTSASLRLGMIWCAHTRTGLVSISPSRWGSRLVYSWLHGHTIGLYVNFYVWYNFVWVDATIYISNTILHIIPSPSALRMANSVADPPQLSESQQLALSTLTSVTDQEPSTAISLLKRSEWNVQVPRPMISKSQQPRELICALDCHC